MRDSAYWKDNYIGWYHAEPTFKLLDVIKQKHWQKLSLRSLIFHDNALALPKVVEMALLMIMKGLGTLYGGDRPTCCVHVHLSKLTRGRQSQEDYQFYGVSLHCMSVIIFHLLPVFVVCKSCHFLTQVIGSQQALCDCEFVQLPTFQTWLSVIIS